MTTYLVTNTGAYLTTQDGLLLLVSDNSFPNIPPDYGLSEESEPKVREAKFGDSYSQRITFGLNQDPKVWPLSWTNITTAEADQIKNFLNDRAKTWQSFDWQPPEDTNTYRWICRKWNRRLTTYNRWTVTATFEQVFEA